MDKVDKVGMVLDKTLDQLSALLEVVEKLDEVQTEMIVIIKSQEKSIRKLGKRIQKLEERTCKCGEK